MTTFTFKGQNYNLLGRKTTNDGLTKPKQISRMSKVRNIWRVLPSNNKHEKVA